VWTVAAPTIGSLGGSKTDGYSRNGASVRHPSPVESDQLLERGTFVGVRVEEAVDQDVGCVRERVGATEVIGGIRAERRSGSSPSMRSSDRYRMPPPPITMAPNVCDRTMTKPMPGWPARPPSRPGMAGEIVSMSARPSMSVKVITAEVARREHDDVGVGEGVVPGGGANSSA
jgi:hypothetical protein